MPIVNAGERFTTNQGCEIEILEYIAYNKVRIKFLDETGYKRFAATKEILNGRVKNPFYPQVRGVGFFGEGPHKAKISGTNITTQEYVHWSGMLTRCYYENYHNRFPTYTGCATDQQWHNFQEFAEWCQWQVGFNEGYVLDKDIIIKGNKIYGPETCVFVPSEINSLVVTQVKPGKGVPAGISFQKSCQKYIVSCAVNGKNKNLGRYTCPEEAFAVYKNFKENLVKEKAEEYKQMLDVRAYHALINFEI